MKNLAFAFALVILLGSQLKSQPREEDPKMKWWKDAKFGMFIHWGVYSALAGNYNGKQVSGLGEWIMNSERIPVLRYRQFGKDFNPVKYDPEAWVKLAKAAGMKYIVITAKHHDGFGLFDSKVTTWDIVDSSPYHKDLLRPLVEAARKEGIRIGFYYSQAQDWVHQGGAAMGGHWDRAQDGDMDGYLERIAIPQVKELLSNYGELDILWWDTPQDMTPRRAEKFIPIVKEHPNLITNNRLGGGYQGDTETPEQFVPATGFSGRNWETCMTMNETWGFKSYDQDWKSTQTILRSLIEATSKGGNLLLNVGPTSEGEIPQPSVERLTEIGKWLDLNQESIYGTTASPFPFLSYGRCTRNGQKLYLHVFDYPSNGQLAVPMSNKITKAYLLADQDRILNTTLDYQRSLINVPADASDKISTVVVVEFEGELMIKPSPMTNKTVTVSSQKSLAEGGQTLLDGDRKTRWVAGKQEQKSILGIDLEKPTIISNLTIDEPWHPWDNKQQNIQLEYKSGAEWKVAYTGVTGGIGHIANFQPVTAQQFRLLVENKTESPSLSEWQLYGPE